ncbi:preprotein translocase subunit SecG [Parasediminibacterium paludis]|uniref:Protein-export membrane protein SecG n=1 Tax=Parasediminibacterium paludis TaxID=908966 RepID=A0ABV8Q1F0_9BACT
MVYLFLALIVLASVALGAIVLIQNPKGGGLAGNVGGLSNNIMGVKQTNDVLEKGTWIFAGAIAVLALTSTLFLKGGATTSVNNSLLNKVNTSGAAPTAPVKK